MKRYVISFIYLLVVFVSTPHLASSAVDPTDLKSFSSIPQQARLVFTRLATRDGINEKDFEFLCSTPGINAALIELSDQVAETENWNQFQFVWAVLQKRSDLNDIEQEAIRKRLREILDVDSGPKGGIIKLCGLAALGNFPSSENELLLIQYLDDTNGSAKNPDSTDIAAESLGRIGTVKSVAALQAYIDKRRPQPGNKSRYYDIAVQALKEVEKRMSSSLPSRSQIDAATSTSTA